ncbi:MAG: MBL fold metallo-hydrolase [Ruminococcaceae bacterium]|nr:MBL fold metallo-hydrolase [Oscillospiraceae bacterium]
MKNYLTQLLTNDKSMDGMGYIIHCDDGSTLAIDGGLPGEEKAFFEALERFSPTERIVVDAWFFSHAHPDHTNVALQVANKYSDKLSVKKFIYNFPDDEYCRQREPDAVQQIKDLEKAISVYNPEIVKAKTGDVFNFGSVKIEVIFTCEDLPSLEEEPDQYFNDTSMVLRMTVGGQKTLFLGDVQAAADRVMIDRYGKELKSDVCQMAHHALASSTSEFYSYVDPEIVLCPASEAHFDDGMYYVKVNRDLIRDQRVKEVIVAGHGTRRMELPIKISAAPYMPYIPDEKCDLFWGENILRLEKAPDDEAWEKIPYRRPKGEIISKKNTYGEYKLCCAGTKLYLKARLFKDDLYPMCDVTSYAACTNIRIHLTKRIFDDLSELWPIDNDEAIRNIMLYPEIKNGLEGFNNMPEIVKSEGRYTDFGWETEACIELGKELDVIGLNLEFNSVDAEGKKNTMLSIHGGAEQRAYRTNPCRVTYFKMEG